MEKIREYYDGIRDKQFDTYHLTQQLNSNDIVNVVDMLRTNNFNIESISVQNIGEEEDFFREFYEKLDYFYVRFPNIPEEKIYSVTILSIYNGKILGLTFDNGLNDLIIDYAPDLNVAPLLTAIDEVCQKKTKGMR